MEQRLHENNLIGPGSDTDTEKSWFIRTQISPEEDAARADACRAEIASGFFDLSATEQNGVRTSSSTSLNVPAER